jgi:xanthine dehydrogenase accessory factor
MLEIYQEITKLISAGERAVLATVISSQGAAPRKAGAKILIKRDGTTIGTIGGGSVEHLICKQAGDMMDSTEAQVVHFDLSGEGDSPGMICGGQMDIFLEPIAPRETLYLFGAGHISQNVAAMGKRLGFQVVVIDPRAEFNNAELFPAADSLMVEEYARAFSHLHIDDQSYIVIFTPGHVFDEQCLEFAAGTGARYIGMIGSEKKVRDIKKRLLAKGTAQHRLDKVHAPIGLAIGAETPEEIAVSILAEIVEVRRASSSWQSKEA